MLELSQNPILNRQTVRAVDVADVTAETKLVRTKREAKRELRDLRRRQTAAEAIRGLTKGNEIYGFTKGQFSLLDLLTAALDTTGPARMSISTWTASRAEIKSMDRLMREGKILSARWLVDFTFARRDPEAAQQVRTTFGVDAIRVSQVHAKFCLFENDDWRLAIRTSMNLNMNPRTEDFTIAHDPELADFLGALLNDIWSKQQRTLAEATPREVRHHFADEF